MILTNKYVLEEKMLDTFQSTLYKGYTVKGRTPIVVKILNQNYSSLEFSDLQEIFHRDSKALSMINHSNIIEYKDSGIDGDNFYIVMEYFQGENLEEFIKINKPSKVQQLHIMVQILNGVQAAHDKRIIHRDIKPSNILINSNMEVKVIDFGVSKILDMYLFKTGHTLKDHITKRYASLNIY